MQTNVTIGSDIEFILERNGSPVSAEGLIPGQKHAPFVLGNGYATQLDNVLAEGNIPPTKCEAEFVEAIFNIRNLIGGFLPAGIVTAGRGAAEYSDYELRSDNAKLFGCDPSYNAWTGAMELPPSPSNANLRSAGFHVHFGYESPSVDMNRRIAKACDVILGLWSVLKDPDIALRRSVGYGSAGNFRNQKHGCEYRTLSTGMARSRGLVAQVYNRAIEAFLVAQTTTMNVWNEHAEDIQNAINRADKDKASALLEALWQ